MGLPNEGDAAEVPPPETVVRDAPSRTPLVVTLAIVLVLGALYYAYYRKQVAYYTGRNLRLLSMLTAQIEDQLSFDPARPLRAPRVQTTFDLVLIADRSGTVTLRSQPPASSSSLLYRQDEDDDKTQAATTRSPLVLTSLKSLKVTQGWRGDPKPLDVGALASATTHVTVTFDGEDYELFAQPFASHPWILCGLVSASHFRYDVMALSASLVLLAIAIALLAICCWPFLRIALIAPSQALTVGDVVLIVFCTITGAAVLTLTLYDVFAYRTITAKADAELEQFADDVNADFGNNVGRATRVLKRVQALGPHASPGQIAGDAVVGEYPYVESVAWIAPDGSQTVKLTWPGPAELVNVKDRRYFRDALAKRTWRTAGEEYVLEWVHSRTTGETRAIVAQNTGDPRLPVISMSTELIDLTHAIRPPGVELAILDEAGGVVYHSDEGRIGYENFFAEADGNRDLRSAVLARGAGFVGAKYWGEDMSMYVRPLKDSPWTIVAFRARRLTRVLNVEGALLALLMLLTSATPYVVLYVLVLLIAPGYRAPRLWPDSTRGGDYLRLALILIALLVLFLANDYILTPWSSYLGAFMIPLIAILSTYLALHRYGAPWRFRIATWLTAIPYVVLLVWIISPVSDADWAFLDARRVSTPKLALLLLTLATAAATALLLSKPSGGARLRARLTACHQRLGYATIYRACGVLLLVVGVVMPVAAFFGISRHVESELLRKYGQLRAAADLEHRIAHLETMSIAPSNSRAVLADIATPRLQGGFIKDWALTPPPAGSARKMVGGPECLQSTDKDWTIPESAAQWLPAFYEDSVAIRPLFEARAADDLWFWCLKDESLKLVRAIRFEEPVARKLWGAQRNGQQLVMLSGVPHGAADFTAYLVLLLGAIPLLLIFWFATHFIASRVLLIDVEPPRWMHLPLSPSLGDHVFLVRRDRDADALTGPDPLGKGTFLDISLAALDAANGWDAMLETVDSSAAGRNVRITDFEYGVLDPKIDEQKLRWLEKLMKLPDRTVLIISTVSPSYVMMQSALPGWRPLLERFATITAEELELRDEERKRQQAVHSTQRLGIQAPSWLEHETEYNSFLATLRKQLDRDRERQHLLDELAERAETYYAGLWSTCREEEKILLHQLARNGLANGRNRRVLRRLIARGLVRRDPNVELFSETFRLFVLEAARRENLAARAHASRPASTWDSLRAPFFVVIVSFLLLLFVTQKDLMSTTTALATALTTGLPALMKLLGTFTERRLDK